MSEGRQTESWIAAAKVGDRVALAKLLAACDPRLRARAQSRMDAAMRARRGPDDLLQDAYAEVVRQIRAFRGGDLRSFVSWANVILDHKLVDARRAAHAGARDIDREARGGGRSGSSSYWNLLENVYADTGTPSRVIRKDEALGALAICLDDLAGDHREVIRLRFLEGLSVEETAERLGRTSGAVVALTKRALATLKRSMDRRGEFTRGA